MDRARQLKNITNSNEQWDVAVIGGGATGLGIALDAASRGYKTVLLEQADFAKGTSSRSTKLAHGGVRYLQQGNIPLVREALRERGLMIKNAPHLVKNETFVIPGYQWWSSPFYTIGLKLYDMLSGSLSIGSSKHISKEETLQRLPTIKKEGLYSGVSYHDGQFDDARLALNIAQTSVEQGAAVLNYAKVTDITEAGGSVDGLTFADLETGDEHHIKAKSVINATGVFVDEILAMEKPDHTDIVRPSQGVHLVFDQDILPGDDAIMIPKTEDGRVLFAVPWHQKVIVGTTDTELDSHSLEPQALDQEVQFILRTLNNYIQHQVDKSDVKSVYAGLRPLAAPEGSDKSTKEISRGHKIMVGDQGLITITGGKWTTYRQMAEDAVDRAINEHMIEERECITEDLQIHGSNETYPWDDPLFYYGSDKEQVLALTKENEEWGEKLHPDYDYIAAQVVWAARNEMARKVDDVLARRMRMLFMDARSAIDMAPKVAHLLAVELGRNEEWEKQQISSFTKLAHQYLLENYNPKNDPHPNT